MKSSLAGIGVTILAVLFLNACGSSPAPPAYLNSGKVLPTGFPFSEAVKVGNTLYLSGQIGNKPGGVEVAEGVRGQATQVMDNIKTSLEAHGYSMANVVKCTVFMNDMAEWGEFNEVYRSYFAEGRYPARSAVGVNGLAFGAKFEVECLAAVP